MKAERHLKYTQTNPISEVEPPHLTGVAPVIAKNKLIQRVKVPKKPIYQMDVIDIMDVYFNKEDKESHE